MWPGCVEWDQYVCRLSSSCSVVNITDRYYFGTVIAWGRWWETTGSMSGSSEVTHLHRPEEPMIRGRRAYGGEMEAGEVPAWRTLEEAIAAASRDTFRRKHAHCGETDPRLLAAEALAGKKRLGNRGSEHQKTPQPRKRMASGQ